MQANTRQYKTIQDNTLYDQARQDAIMPNMTNTRQYNINLDTTSQANTRHYNTIKQKTRQDELRQDKTNRMQYTTIQEHPTRQD